MAISPGNFRRAEEASNAEGMTKAALDFAKKNAQKNPTKENLKIFADTNAARQETLTAQGKSPAQIAAQVKAIVDGAPGQAAELDKTIKEANAAIEMARQAGIEASAAGGFNLTTGKRDLVLAALQELGIPASMQQSSLAFIETAMADGFTQEAAIQLYYNLSLIHI